jgi:hypothetical protein
MIGRGVLVVVASLLGAVAAVAVWFGLGHATEALGLIEPSSTDTATWFALATPVVAVLGALLAGRSAATWRSKVGR